MASLLRQAEAAATRRPRLALLLLCLCLFLPGFFSIPASDRDEARFAAASRQMVETGDYIRIRIGEDERNKKPVGIHWAQAAAVHALELVGIPARAEIFAYRIPSALGAMLAVLATFAFGRRLVGRRAALLAAAMLAGCMVLVVEAHIAKTDAALLATIAAAMGLFGMAYLRPEAFSARQAAAFWGVLGLSLLIKGPIGPMVALLCAVTLAIIDRGAPWLSALRPAWGVALMLGIAAPWLIAIGIATEGRFFAEAVGHDMLGKVGQGQEAHWGPPGYYLATFFIAAFPAAVLALPALRQAWAERSLPATRFLLAWIVPTWLLFEAVATKLPHYTLPAYPALMLLIARWTLDPLRLPPAGWMAWAMRLVPAAVAIGLAAAAIAAPLAAAGHLAWPALLAAPPALLVAWLTWREYGAGRYARGAVLSVMAAIPLYAAVLEATLPRLTPIWVAPRLEASLARHAPGLAPERFAILGHPEPSVQFHIGGMIRKLHDGAAAAAFLAEGPGRIAAVEGRFLDSFLAEAAARGLPLQALDRIEGYNYSRGRRIVLTLYGVAP
ncbi:MAG: glycosyltransferase family 39 protein [Rhodovarius sp.]|nr:glycosyltransferase family 39 protein [Rhodovarius sp.]